MTSDGISKSTPTAPKQMVNRNSPQVTRQLTSAAECKPSTWQRKRTRKARQVCGNIKNAAVAFTVIKVVLHFRSKLLLRFSSRGAPPKKLMPRLIRRLIHREFRPVVISTL